MSSEAPIIRVRDLTKSYRLGEAGQRYQTLRETLAGFAAAPLRRFRRLAGKAAQQERLLAIDGLEFDVHPGERLGVIGHNGAGKSTLLKLLSRITRPTGGTIELRGRVASLLEIGTGFHPELTGRENIFLNGTILGMGRAEILKKFDQIVDFAEIRKFLDTPVKRYSSGMYVRLAFSVAAHLEPEILLVDEVLAVGDARFQQRCLGKMEDVSREEGRTILFVSHNLQAIKRICSRVMMLEQGRITRLGPTEEVVQDYKDSMRLPHANADNGFVVRELVPGKGIRLTKLRADPDRVPMLDQLRLEAEFSVDSSESEYSAFFALTDLDRTYVGSVYSRDEDVSYGADQSGRITVSCLIRPHTLLPGEYHVEAGLFNRDGQCAYWVDSGALIQVERTMFNGRAFDGRGGYATHRGQWSGAGAVCVDL